MDASPPYDRHPVADLVLHSSDDVSFYVLGSLLRFVSPIFRDMFSINHGQAIDENDRKDDLPVVHLEENSEALRLLLDLIYPSAEEPLFNVSLLWSVGKAAKKYFIDVVETKLKNRTLKSDMINDEPLRLYAIAINLGWEDVATMAAWMTLEYPLENLPPVEELKSITGSDFYRLLEYRVRCDTSTDVGAEKLIDLPTSLSKWQLVVATPFSIAATDARRPFGSSPAADLILRSSNFVDFYVPQGLMRLVSPHFDSMFPFKKPQTKNGYAIICVADDSDTMYQLLKIIYHLTDEIDLKDFELYTSVVKAARKYRMATIESKLRKQALASRLSSSDSLRMYAFATTLQWEDVAKAAALNTFPQPLNEISYLKELDWITGADLHRLVSFRSRCGDAACRSLVEDGFFMVYGIDRWQCHWNGDGNYRGITSKELLKKIKGCPRGSTADELYALELEKIGQCSRLSIENGALVRGMMECRSNIGKVIEKAISEVFLLV